MIKSGGGLFPLPERNMKQSYQEAAEDLNKKLTYYLSREGLTSIEAASEKQLEDLLSAYIKDFLNYQLFFDDFSSLCEQNLSVLQNRTGENDTDLFWICHYGAELSWYIRNEPIRAGHFLERILEWYKAGTDHLE
jgi:hypothetical protein